MTERLTSLQAGMPVVWGGNRVTYVDEDLAAAFEPGDALIVMQDDGTLLHVPEDALVTARDAVTAASSAFDRMGDVTDDQISEFYLAFAAALSDDGTFAPIAAANADDVASARGRGRSVTRLILDDRMRDDMVAGLRGWASSPTGRGRVIDVIEHPGWQVEQIVDGLGVIGFVFEGRPNVFADATGVLRGGNTVVFRIGSDALGTAEAIVEHALAPALSESGLPEGAASLVASASRAAGWAMMADPRLSLAVARGSGPATSQLGAVARQAGNAVSLHGTGGAWIVAGEDADVQDFAAAVYRSLDRKVCNTVNTVCIPQHRADDLVPAFLHALERAGEKRGVNSKLHVDPSAVAVVPEDWFMRTVPISRAQGLVEEPQAERLEGGRLGHEWEWEDSPEVTLCMVSSVDEAVTLFNRFSPKFAASLVSQDGAAHDRFFATIDSPFVGNGFTRWVDGQYAFAKPELGLSNWEHGRLFGRSGILSGDSAYSVRVRAVQDDPDIGR
ncbi:MAG: aldehyde dehydrogenase family protein [Acidimicrobiia bacterium]|nr:aldehyde dehydrogenase family protein [Acidimicrobiia bacterium]